MENKSFLYSDHTIDRKIVSHNQLAVPYTYYSSIDFGLILLSIVKGFFGVNFLKENCS
jgi:hypothetical protein